MIYKSFFDQCVNVREMFRGYGSFGLISGELQKNAGEIFCENELYRLQSKIELDESGVFTRQDAFKNISNEDLHLHCLHSRFTFQGGSFTLSEGGLAYLPLTSHHLLEILSPEIRFYRVNFTLSVEGENALFSHVPLKLSDSVSAECADGICQLEQVCRQSNDTVLKNAKLCAVFAALQASFSQPVDHQLAPAVRYLQQNFTQPLDCKYLAQLCYVSTTRFYFLFQRSFGMTPLQYRDRLLTDRAIMLLKFGDLRINEIAQMLGFSDPAYFSRFFKKQTGCSPKQFLTGRDSQ